MAQISDKTNQISPNNQEMSEPAMCSLDRSSLADKEPRSSKTNRINETFEKVFTGFFKHKLKVSLEIIGIVLRVSCGNLLDMW